MLEARGIGLGVLLTLLVLAVLIAMCGVLLVPHLLVRGACRVLHLDRRPRLIPPGALARSERLLGPSN